MRALIGLSLATISLAALAAPPVAAQASPTPAVAPTDAQRARCANEDFSLHISSTEAMAACTLIINMKPTDPQELALAYSNRAVAEDSLGLHAQSNADLRAAHRIDPADFEANPPE
ncbi:MAG TPA: hypothetical protein VG407_11940 [Caulobacteraceae bacterium]|jgi:hypothetical protein|nr:hypothetical protein [Caulobacteraceae bacterium]